MKDTSPLPLAPYLTLSRDLSAVIVPVQPRSEFRAELYHSLLAQAAQCLPAADRSPAAGIPVRFARWVIAAPGPDRRWVWGAAAVGSAVSLAGVITYFWRQRGRRAA